MSAANIGELLKRLSEAHGISGYEDEVREIVKDALEPFADEIRVDNMGNLVAVKKGETPSVMIAAHMDEIGMMVKQIDDDGFIRFTCIGGWFDQTLLHQRVILHTPEGNVRGVIGAKPPHVMREDERKKVVEARDMFIDIGASSRDEVEKRGISIGTPITIDRDFTFITDHIVTCKAFDNRSGVTAMIEAFKRTSSSAEVVAVATVQEEVGLKGARTSAFEISPDIAIATDVAIAGGHPGIDRRDTTVELGKGPVITVSDAAGRGIITPRNVLKWLEESAKKYEIPYQLSVSEGGTTDATAIQIARSGIPTGVVSIPTRYIHSPVEMLDLKDLDRCAELIAKALETVHEYC